MANLAAPTAEEITARSEEARTHRVQITTKRGVIELKLFPEIAPVHVASFLNLVHSGYYDGIVIHRVEPGFVIQAGCPNGDGTGGPGYTIPAEFNERKHVKGTLSMARTSAPDSAGSQFFICLATTAFLDGQYTVFGETVAGEEILTSIKRGDIMDKVTVIEAN